MSLSRTEQQTIAAGALTLSERLALPEAALVADAGLAHDRLDRWGRALGADFPDRLRLRREALGLAADDRAARVLGHVRPEAIGSLPGWTADLARLSDLFEAEVPVPPDLARVPFADLIWPLAHEAARRAVADASLDSPLVSPQAVEDIGGALLRILSTVMAHCLYAEFDLWRRLRRGGDPYGSFARHFRSGGYRRFLTDYPWLGRRLVTFFDSHVTTTAIFLHRLAEDQDRLQARADLPVQRLNIGLSDRHEGGATVIVIDFASGRKLVYKPKPIDSELWFSKLADVAGTLAAIPGGLVNPDLRVIARPGFGWVSFVDHQSCTAPDEVERFYLRAGGLLALVHAVNGYDFHEENVIASGEWPTLIDFETLFNPEPLRPDGQGRPSWSLFSVTNTMMLTSWMPSAHGGSVDIGGLTGCLDAVEEDLPQYLDPNSATMRWGIARRPPRRGTNLVRLRDRPQVLADHLPGFREGFSRVYGALTRNAAGGKREPVPEIARLLRDAESLVFRHILRHTRIYVSLLESSYRPDLNRSGLDMSLHYEQVERVSFLGTWKRDQNDFVRLELDSLLAEDVPVFYRRNDGRDLLSAEGVAVPGFFGSSGIAACRRHLEMAGAEEMWRQEELIAATVFAAAATPDRLEQGVEGDPFRPDPGADAQALLLARAREIGQDLIRRAFVFPDGSLNWQGAVASEAHRRYQVGGLDHGVYSGNGGIALFLAALDLAFPGQGHGARALATMSLAADDLGRPDDVARFRVPLGGFSGAGALIYANVRLAAMLGAPAPLETADRLAAMIAPVHIGMDRQFDVLGGAAGLILVLLDLADATGDDTCLDKAALAAQHLLSHAIVQDGPSGPALAWPSESGVCHGGFAHGAAGIGVALIRLGHRLGRDDFVACGMKALAYQDGLWDAGQDNWRDLRRADGGCSCQWCYGATGAGFAWLALEDHLPGARVRLGRDRAIAAVMQSVSAAGGALVDHLCCGNAGSALLLHRAGMRDAARAMAAGLARARRQPDDFVLYARGVCRGPVRQPVFPGLMQGTAGIGMMMLAIARPDLPIPDFMTLSGTGMGQEAKA